MSTKKYIFRFFLNSLLWCLIYFSTELLTPSVPKPESFGDINMLGFYVASIMFSGFHLIPFYLIFIKNISNKLNFFLINTVIIIIFNPMSWLSFILTDSSNFEIKQFLLEISYTTIIHISVFIICFFIKQIYFKFNK